MHERVKYVEIPASKSILNRLLIIATMMDNPLKFRNFSDCEDVRTMTENIARFGFEICRYDDYYAVEKKNEPPENIELFIKDSATALRFLLARSAVSAGHTFSIDASAQLKKRPHEMFIRVLKQLGADFSRESFPLRLTGASPAGGRLIIEADISSQFVSALMLIAPKLENDLEIVLKNQIVSSGYIQLTAKIMQEFGIKVKFDKNKILIPAGQKYHKQGIFEVEADYSSAAYFWAIGANSSNWIATQWQDSWQPDFKFLTILEEMGAIVKKEKDVVLIKKGKLNGITKDMSKMPDQVPTLAVLAVFASTPTVITNIEHLKFKESNRIESVISELRKLNIEVEYKNAKLTIYPAKTIKETEILSSHADHRIAMALFICKYFFPGIIIEHLDCIRKSNPNFIELFNSLTENLDT